MSATNRNPCSKLSTIASRPTFMAITPSATPVRVNVRDPTVAAMRPHLLLGDRVVDVDALTQIRAVPLDAVGDEHAHQRRADRAAELARQVEEPVALPRCASGKSDSASTLTGMKMNPRPKLRIMFGRTRSQKPASRVRCEADELARTRR